jgi:hypothetical protein
MSGQGFAIGAIVVTGPGKSDAGLHFRRGLNVVVGASNTGKTYAFQLIDFLLGASRTPKGIPASTGYSHALAEMHARAGGVLTLWRALAGGGALAYSAPIDGINSETPSTALAEQHERGNVDTISGRLLSLTGLFGREIRKNVQGDKRSLSFRDVAWLILVDEERIITERSPVLSGQYTSPTEEKSVFGLFLTGVDDAAIVPQEKPEQRKLRLRTEMQILEGLLDDRASHLRSLEVDAESLADQQDRVAAAIQAATELLATQQSELDHAAQRRDGAWSEIRDTESRRLFLAEQLKRLRLLREHYASDASRLESALEAGELFECLPTGDCPVCGHRAEDREQRSETDIRLEEFHEACKAERTKIAALTRDLELSLSELTSEDRDLQRRVAALNGVLTESNALITNLLDQKVRAADTRLTQLLQVQKRLSEAAYTSGEIADLRSRYSVAEQALAQKIPRAKFAKKVEARDTVRFCEIVAATLRTWKFPFSGNVSWSDDYFDIIIGDENRGNLGKGYRAVTHAAFTLSLMRFCREMGRPHPGIVVLDTPLNPFKGPDRDSAERVNQEVQEAFYRDLTEDRSGDQIIVFENTEPPADIRGQIQYEHFSGNPSAGRAGFFPAPSSEAGGAANVV